MSDQRHRLRGLYAITDTALQPPQRLAAQVGAAIDGGATLIQYRDKSGDAARRRQQAQTLAGLCRARGVLLVVNDDVELAARSGAHGVHLGRDDGSVADARRRLGDAAVIGVSCYDSRERAERAAAEGADYLAFGRFFPSRTKPDAVQAGVELLRDSKRELPLPVAAIGGITPDNAAVLIEAGADMLAVVRGVFAATDVRRAAAAYAELFQPGHGDNDADKQTA